MPENEHTDDLDGAIRTIRDHAARIGAGRDEALDALRVEIEQRREAIETRADEADRLRRRVRWTRARSRAIRRSRWWRLGTILRRLLGWARDATVDEFREVDALLDARRYEDAVVELDRILVTTPSSLNALRRKREALTKMGEISAVLGVLRRMRTVRDDQSVRREERLLLGRLRELDPSWLPDLSDGRESVRPAAPLRVLHILKHSLPHETNGYTVRSGYTLARQRYVGMDPVVMTSLGFPRTSGVTLRNTVEDVDGIRHHRLDLGPMCPYSDLSTDEALTATALIAQDIIRAERPALIHARSGFRGFETALVAMSLARRFGLPWIYEVSSFLEATWTSDPERAERGELHALRRRQELRCMSAADHVVTISESMRTEIVSRGVDPDKVTVIPNAVDATEFGPIDPDPALARELDLDGRMVLGYVSNLGPREGIDILIEATAILVRRGLPLTCLIVGDGPERPRLEQLAHDLGIASSVRLVGAVPHRDVKRYYALIDVFVIPRRDDFASRWVTPLKPFEAMAMGKPLLVSALPALLEIAVPEIRGLAFSPGDPMSLATQAEVLIRDTPLRRRVGETGRAWVQQHRTWARNGEQYRALYESLLKGSARVRASARSPGEDARSRDLRAARAERRRTLDGNLAAMAPFEEDLAALDDEERSIARRTTSLLYDLHRAQRRLSALENSRLWRLRGSAKRLVRIGRTTGSPTVLAAGVAEAARPAPVADEDAQRLLHQGIASIRSLTARGAHPTIIAYYPFVRNNPYQSMLYAGCWDASIATIPITSLDELEHAPALARLGADVWLHLHWTSAVLGGATSRDEAVARVAEFGRRLVRFRAHGGKILWTIHNVLPHERAFPDLEGAVCRLLADASDAIHVLCEETVRAVEPIYPLPKERVHVISHASYEGVYPDTVSRDSARLELGLLEEHTALTVFGGIRRYKGLDAILTAFEEVSKDRPHYRLVIAGPPFPFEDLDRLQERCARNASVITRFARVPEAEVQSFLKAADVIVLPYVDALNSGVLMLAFSYGRPVIAPRRGCIASLVPPDAGVLFDPTEANSLERALREADSLRDARFSQAALRIARSSPPAAMAGAFVELMRRVSGVAASGDGPPA